MRWGHPTKAHWDQKKSSPSDEPGMIPVLFKRLEPLRLQLIDGPLVEFDRGDAVTIVAAISNTGEGLP